MSAGKVVIALNTAWNLVNFRAGLIRALTEAGYEVVAVAPADKYVSRLSGLGCRYVPLPMDNQGVHPGRDALLFWRFFKILQRERPLAYLGYTVKPNVYGSLAANMLGVPVINNIAGLGSVFIRKGWLEYLVRNLYRLSLARSRRVFFQNDEDLRMFVGARLVRPSRAVRLPGSGVDLGKFTVRPLPGKSSIRFLMVARMLWDKGVAEYVEAARQLRRSYPDAEFCMAGFLDVENPAAIPRNQIFQWVAEGVVNFLGESDDIRDQIAAADCVVLPSYREGVPRSLLEAAAMGRPIVTTDAVGCRDVVEDGFTGFLCRPRNSVSLAEAMKKIICLTPCQRSAMGLKGRAKVEQEFDERVVIQKYLEALAEIGEPRELASLR